MTTATVEQGPVQEVTELQGYERKATELVIQDDLSVQQGLLFIKECKDAQDRVEEKRKAEVQPHLDKQREINGLYKPVVDAFEKLWRAMDQKVGAYRMKKKRELEEQQRQAIEDARKKKAEEEAKAAELRRQAEEAAKAATVDTTDTETALEQIRVQKAAAAVAEDHDTVVVLEAKEARLQAALDEAVKPSEVRVVELQEQAQKAELTAALVVPEVVPQQQKTVQLAGGGKMGFRTTKIPILPGGLSLDGDYYRDDKRLGMLPDNLFILDIKRLKKWVKDGQTFPGVEVFETESSTR